MPFPEMHIGIWLLISTRSQALSPFNQFSDRLVSTEVNMVSLTYSSFDEEQTGSAMIVSILPRGDSLKWFEREKSGTSSRS